MLRKIEGRGEGGDRGWGGEIASQTQQACMWANSRRQWETGKRGVLQSMGSQRDGQDWATEQQQLATGEIRAMWENLVRYHQCLIGKESSSTLKKQIIWE